MLTAGEEKESEWVQTAVGEGESEWVPTAGGKGKREVRVRRECVGADCWRRGRV